MTTGCVTNESGLRWATAPGEQVQVNGTNYWVAWVAREGGYDLRSGYKEIVSTLDEIADKANAVTAAKQVGAKLCGRPIAIETEDKAGRLYSFRIRCA
jgi:secreted PhoX family phosphatase